MLHQRLVLAELIEHLVFGIALKLLDLKLHLAIEQLDLQPVMRLRTSKG